MGPTVKRAVAYAGLVILVLLIAVISSDAGAPAGAVDLAGRWHAREIGGRYDGPFTVPGLFGHGGMRADARVELERTVEVPDDGARRALWIENPQYALRVRWDGVVLDESGDVEGRGPSSDVAVLIDIPPGSGRHVLGLELDGRGGEGGVLGRVLFGPRELMRGTWARMIAEQTGLSLMLAMLGVLHLGVAVRAPRRDAYLYFGLFACTMAVWAFCVSDVSAFLLPGLDAELRLRRVAHAFLPGLGAAFVASFLYDRVTAFPRWVLAFGAVAAATVPVLPLLTLYRVEETVDAVTLVTLVWFTYATASAVRRGAKGTYLLVLTTVPPMVVGATSNILVTHGVIGGGSFLFPGFAWFMGGCAVALAVRNVDEAARLERFVAGAGDPILTVDASGVVRDVNPAGRAVFGDVFGTDVLAWVRTEDHAAARAHLSWAPQRVDRAEIRVVLGPRREMIVDSIATSLDDGNVLLSLRDVTVRRKADETLLRAARIEMMGALASGVAHDFNNILGTLLAQVGLLQGAHLSEAETSVLQRMERTIERSSVLIKRLLTAVGGTQSELESVDVGALIRESADLVAPMLPRHVALDVDVPTGDFLAMGATSDLEQVFVNLLVNARDALVGRPVGRIAIRARRWHVGQASGVAVVVDDDGPGVPEAMRREIFEPFVTTKAPGKGTGLGLAVCARVLRDAEGRIWVEERPGGGARFVLALRAANLDRDATGGLPEGRRVLVVEDEDALRDTFVRLLTDAGYTVEACSGGAQAVRSLRERAPDVLVTDVVMPEVSGLVVAETCQRLYPGVPILLVSGFLPDEALVALQRWSWYRLDKPVRGSRLVATVGRIRRHAERRERGESEITDMSQAMPPLDGLTSAALT